MDYKWKVKAETKRLYRATWRRGGFCGTSLFGFWLVASARLLAGNFYAGTSPTNVPWPGGVVPYEFTNTLTAAQQETYLDGLREWELAANVNFVPHTNQARWILFSYNTNFLDFVSGGYGPQMVTVSSLSRAQVCHEMGHSFGFTHENIRPDATNYITVLTNNIADEPTNIYWFTIDPTSVPQGNYDFESVMHLAWDFASADQGVLATQEPKPPYFPRYQFRMGNYCISPGDRAALAYLYGPSLVPLTNVVTTTADVGPGTLRGAIYYATDHPGSPVRFNIPASDPGYSNGVFNIHLTGQLPPLVANGMVIDGSTQPGFTGPPLIVLDGLQVLPETFTSDTGLLIYSSSNQVRGISFMGFNWNGLTLIYADATNNGISGCWFGLSPSGSNAAPNAYQGILIEHSASGNTIGGTNALAGNVLSGNSQYGIYITDSNTTGNILLGNYIGTDARGSNAVPNALSGVLVGNGASGNVVGGTNALARNLLSGNLQYGLWVSDPTTSGNAVLGNYIGTDFSGNRALANAFGGVIIVNGAEQTVIGGTSVGARNVISGNTNFGLWLGGSGTVSNTVQGNFFGLNAAGDGVLPNSFAGMYLLGGAQNNRVLNNVFSGQPSEGLRLTDPGTSGNVVQGNLFGTDASGSQAVPNGYAGVTVLGGATSNTIGGVAAGARNLISGNYYGMVLSDPGTSGNVVEGNLIGTDVTGTNALGDSFAGVDVQNGACANFIGGIAAGQGNLIAFNRGPGVVMYDAATTNDAIRGNSIFSNGDLGINFNNAGVASNHLGFLAGPNDLQNFPIITNAFGYANSTIVAGTLNSLANHIYFIDLYRSVAADPSGYGEGQFYVGAVSVTTDGSGNAVFVLTNATGNYAGQYLAATATSEAGDTSEFSLAVVVTNTPAPRAEFLAPFEWQSDGFTFTLNLETNFSYRIQSAPNLAARPVAWTDLTNLIPTNSVFNFTDRTTTNYRVRFYRVISP